MRPISAVRWNQRLRNNILVLIDAVTTGAAATAAPQKVPIAGHHPQPRRRVVIRKVKLGHRLRMSAVDELFGGVKSAVIATVADWRLIGGARTRRRADRVMTQQCCWR